MDEIPVGASFPAPAVRVFDAAGLLDPGRMELRAVDDVSACEVVVLPGREFEGPVADRAVVVVVEDEVEGERAVAAGADEWILGEELCTNRFDRLVRRLARLPDSDRIRARVARGELCERLLAETGDIVTVVAPDGRQLFVNNALHRVLGYDEAPTSFPAPYVHPDDVDRLTTAFKSLVSGDGATDLIEYRVRHANGEWRWVQVTGRNCASDPQIQGAIGVTRDITAQKVAEERIAHLAFHDPLTGLANRALFADRLRLAIGRLGRQPGWVAVFVVDLDWFKVVNDSLGHLGGDEVLRRIAGRLERAVRPTDTAARLGGDEFIVVAEFPSGDGHAGVEACVGRVLESIRRPIVIDGQALTVTASIGVAVTSAGDADPERLISAADAAAYEAKRAGRAQACSTWV